MTNAFDEWDRQCDHINSDKQMLYQQMKECLKKEESADALYRMAKVCFFFVSIGRKGQK